MANKYDYDLDGWAKAQEFGKELINQSGKLNEMRKQVDDAYFMDWSTSNNDPSVKLTISPDPHNKLEGAVRLLTSTSPKWDVPREKNDPDTEDVSSRIEQMANTMWARSNSVQARSVEKEIALMGFMYDEMQLQVVSTRDILKSLEAAGTNLKAGAAKEHWQGELDNAKEIAARTPYLFEPLLPTVTGWSRSRTGVDAHYSQVYKTVGSIRTEWGARAADLLEKYKDYESLTLCSFWDRTYRYVWIQEASAHPIYAESHGLGFIPIVVNVPYGTTMFDRPEHTRMPFLYSALRSGIWERQNLLLTAAMTNAAALINAQFLFTQGTDGAAIEVDASVIGGIVTVPPGSNFQSLVKQIINPEVMQLISVAGDIMNRSTIYDQSLGQPLGGGATFSESALMSQSGRLPLTSVMVGMERLCSDAMEIAFKWMRLDKGEYKLAKDQSNQIELKAAEIPERIEFNVTVDVDLAQDKLQAANAALAITGGDHPLESQEWARKNLLGDGQSDATQKQIWREQFANTAAMMTLQQFLQEQMQAQQPPQQPGGAPGGQPQPGQPTPEQMQQMQQMQAQQQQQQGPVSPAGPVQPQGLPQEMAGGMPETMPPEMQGGQ